MIGFDLGHRLLYRHDTVKTTGSGQTIRSLHYFRMRLVLSQHFRQCPNRHISLLLRQNEWGQQALHEAAGHEGEDVVLLEAAEGGGRAHFEFDAEDIQAGHGQDDRGSAKTFFNSRQSRATASCRPSGSASRIS